MDKGLYKFSKQLIKQAFPKYKKIQVGATIKEVEIYRKKNIGRFVGTQLFNSSEAVKEIIPMEKFTKVYNQILLSKTDLHQLYVAVDQRTNTVYWNFEHVDQS